MRAVTVIPRQAGSARLDQIAEPALVADLGATYHTGTVSEAVIDL